MQQISTNVHPTGKWKSVTTHLWGVSGGNSLGLTFTDEAGEHFAISIHYNGDKAEASSLLLKLREALDTLPKTERCGCSPECDKITLKGELEYN